jgi:hypothetical protein
MDISIHLSDHALDDVLMGHRRVDVYPPPMWPSMTSYWVINAYHMFGMSLLQQKIITLSEHRNNDMSVLRDGYDFPPYRPPNEASSALIRATRGCPWNRCEFCTMYKGTRFQMRPLEDVIADIDKAAGIFAGARSVFIADSDSLVRKDVEDILRHVKVRFPDAERVTSYGRARTLRVLGPERLSSLREAGLTRVHMGLESGDAETLELMAKGVTPDEMIAGGTAAREAGLDLSLYVLIGAGGSDRLKEHALGSATVCNEIDPDFIRLRTLVVQHDSPLEAKMRAGLYRPTSPGQKLEEVRTFVDALDLTDCELASDHFTNFIWIDHEPVYDGVHGRLPSEKRRLLSKLDRAIDLVRGSDGDVQDATMLYERGLIQHL